jgi:Uma2 family endonuclease
MMSSAHRYLPSYTVKDYQGWEGDWELWQGIPVSMTPSLFGLHQKVAVRLITELQKCVDATKCDAVVLSEIDWVVAEDTVVRPDVLLLCGDVPQRHVEHPPVIIAEVLSAATAHRDRTAKFDLYQEHGVEYYLMLDPDQNILSAFQLNDSGVYQPQNFSDELVLKVCEDCELRFPAASLFT